VLFLNNIINDIDVLDGTTLPKLRMPNRDNPLPLRYSCFGEEPWL
jgi:hypothetical protein